MTTIRQVASACGVSPMTVSLVLNNGGRVSEQTRERVLRAVRDLDYRPGPSERSSRRNRTDVVGVMTAADGPSFTESGYGNWILRSILRALDQNQKHLLLYTKMRLEGDPHASIRKYCDGRCDGLIVLAPPAHSPMVAAIAQRGFPMVIVASTGEIEYPTVDIDNVGEGTRLTRYLIEKGHRRIVFLGGPDFVPSSMQRLQGYRRALREAGIPADPRLEILNIVRPTENVGRLRALFGASGRLLPTAIFAWHDSSALDALAVLKELELRVPGDVSVVGINDDEQTAHASPPLTTVRQPYDDIGRIAVEKLLASLAGKEVDNASVLLAGVLIERASVGPPSPDPD